MRSFPTSAHGDADAGGADADKRRIRRRSRTCDVPPAVTVDHQGVEEHEGYADAAGNSLVSFGDS